MMIPRLSVPEVRRCWRSSAVLLSWFAISFVMFFSPMDAKAFKAETHVWVGQQVLNDVLPDGRVTISIDGVPYDYPVDPSVVSALQSNSAIYRMGNIGPDAFPDMFTGQFVVHPGIDGAWQTDDWLKWIYKRAVLPQEKAFAYGYLAHAATDVFSHTYVNNYSGDIFVLGDGEIENEKRHFALEKYIVQHTPPLTDTSGGEIGLPYSALSTPASFMRDNLILNNTVADQYTKGDAKHLAAIQNLRERLNNAYGPLEQLDRWAVRILAEYFLDLSLNNDQAAKVYELAQNIHQIIDNNNGVDQLQKAKDDLVNAVVKTGNVSIDLLNNLNNALATVFDVSGRLDAKILELNQKQTELYNTAKELCNNVCNRECTRSCPPLLPCEDICNDVCHLVCNPNPAYAVLENAVAELLAAKGELEGELLQANSALTEAVGLAVTAANENLEAQNDIINGLIDTTQLMTADLNMMRAEVDGWRSDIVSGMDAYVLANAEVIKESMKDGGDLVKPLKYWIDCWSASVFMGIPSPLTNTACSVQNRAENMSNAISDFEARMGKVMEKLVPLLGEWNDLKQKITNEIESTVNREAMDFLETETGVAINDIVELLRNPVDDATLNALFATDVSGKHLPLLPNIAEIVTAEMKLSPDGYFDPEKYEVAHNSVVLAKLALLNREQLNKFAFDAGVTLPTIYGDKLYLEDGMVNSSNIIFGWIRSIDGNHQWLQTAPPYPRQTGGDPLWPDKRHYGYGFGPSAEGYTGLRIWEYSNARENAFLRIFSGTFFDPGIQNPAIYNLTVSKAGNGLGTVTSSPFGVSCGTDCSEHYVQGATITLTATPSSGSLFAGWSGGGCSGTGVCVVAMNAAVSVTATFNLTTLTVTKIGTGSGTVTSSPAGVSCGADCTEVYPAGTSVTLTASPSTGSSFAGWSGGVCSGTGTCAVTMNADITVTAIFNVIPTAIPASINVPSASSNAGSYTVSWGASTTAGVTYTLQEATDNKFTIGLRTVTSGATALSASITGRTPGSYYYRVGAVKNGVASGWRTGTYPCTVPYFGQFVYYYYDRVFNDYYVRMENGVEIVYNGPVIGSGLSYGVKDAAGRYYWEIGGYRYTQGALVRSGAGWFDYKVCKTNAGVNAP